MSRKIKNITNIHTEKVTNEQFDEIIGHSENKRKYFTIENNNIIYKRLKKETDLNNLPYLGICVDFGLGDVCIEESIKDGIELFKFYVIDRSTKFDYQEFNKIEDIIEKLVDFYTKNEMVSNPEKVRSIFIETLNISKPKKLSLSKNYNYSQTNK